MALDTRNTVNQNKGWSASRALKDIISSKDEELKRAQFFSFVKYVDYLIKGFIPHRKEESDYSDSEMVYSSFIKRQISNAVDKYNERPEKLTLKDRRRLIAETLDRLFHTEFISKPKFKTFDPAFSDLIRSVVVKPTLEFLNELMRAPMTASKNLSVAIDDIPKLEQELRTIMRTLGVNNVVSTVLDSKESDENKLRIVSRLGLNKLTDPESCMAFHDLLFRLAVTDSGDSGEISKIISALTATNLPKFDLAFSPLSEYLMEYLPRVENSTQLYLISSKLEKERFAEKGLEKFRKFLLEDFRERTMESLVTESSAVTDCNSLAKFSARTFLEFFTDLPEKSFDLKQQFRNGVIREMISSSLDYYGTLSDSCITFLDTLAEDKEFKELIKDELKSAPKYLAKLPNIFYKENKLMRFLLKTFGVKEFQENFVDQATKFHDFYKRQLFAIEEFISEPKSHVFKLDSAMEWDPGSPKTGLTIAVAPLIMEPAEIADRMKLELERTDSPLSEKQLDQCFEALSEAGQEGLDVLFDLASDGVDPQKDFRFYLKIIDTIFSMLSSDETRASARLVLARIKEGMYLLMDLLGTSKRVDLTEKNLEKLAKLCMKLYNAKPIAIQERLLQWLQLSPDSNKLLDKINSYYLPHSKSPSSVKASLYLRSLRYLASLNSST